MAKVKPKKKSKLLVSPFKDYWTKQNYLLFTFGLLIIIVGFILMSQSPWNNTLSLTVSPLILLIAYLVVIPLSILYKKKKTPIEENVSSKD